MFLTGLKKQCHRQGADQLGFEERAKPENGRLEQESADVRFVVIQCGRKTD